MSRSRYVEWLLNGATVLVTICAVVIAGLRIRDEVVGHSSVGAAGTRTISNWREFGNAGTRIGAKNAPVTIVEFLDFQCPFCRVASGSIRDLRRWYTKDLAVVYRHLPIPFHKFAYPAALAAECGARANRFEAIHDALFAQPDSIGQKRWTRFALDAGIADTSGFALCMEDKSVGAAVRRDSVAAVALGVTATPTFLINNVVVSGNVGFAALNGYVKAALDESRH